MKKQQLAAILLMSVLLSGCAGGTDDTETVSPEESARLESLACAEAQAQSEQLAEESRLAEEESRKLAEEEAAALLQKQLEEDRAMAERDFEENRYRTIHDVIELELTFMDSFNGHYLDETKWAYCPNWERDDCIWTEDAAYLEDGALILAVTGDGVPYHAGAIRTRGLFEQTYGYWEIRAKLPQAEGINAAFWLMCDGAGHAEVSGAADGVEIDIIESPHHDWSQVQHALHCDGYEEAHKTLNHPIDIPGIYDDAWHTFALEWTPEGYYFYIDGEETWKKTGKWACHVPCYAKLTAAVGGWAGTLDPSLTPVYGMQVDYIKVYRHVAGYDCADEE